MCAILRGSTCLSMPIRSENLMSSINPEKITYLDNSTISIFIHCYEKFKDESQFVLTGPQDSLREVFGMAKLRDVFQIFPDAPKAME